MNPSMIRKLHGMQAYLSYGRPVEVDDQVEEKEDIEEDMVGKKLWTEIYNSDEFKMFDFKVRRCMRVRSHDWTDCPFAHPGEKARRRDPRRYHYSGTPCNSFRRDGICQRGDKCEFSHGVFEFWLHPSRYRTIPCKDGQNCQRKVCFFAHNPNQLRLTTTSTSTSILKDKQTSKTSNQLKKYFSYHSTPYPPTVPSDVITDMVKSMEIIQLNSLPDPKLGFSLVDRVASLEEEEEEEEDSVPDLEWVNELVM